MKRQFKSQASSGRAEGGFGSFGGFASAGFGPSRASTLSYIQEPPDYFLISDANVAVAFKSLAKKDSTTKAKALEDLQSIFTSDAPLEDTVVEAWIRVYPRLAIENARRVRQLSHTLNGQICAKCGKRIAKHLPRLAGPWLAGTFDNDRAAAKAAQDALSSVFPSPDKIAGLRRTFQQSILEYCKDALLQETVQTLSDARSVSVEDAEATYARVVSSSIAVVTRLLETLSTEEVTKHQPLYQELIGNSKLWEFAYHGDAGVRRSFHRLVQICVKIQTSLVQENLKTASKAYIDKGLSSHQTGSAVDFLLVLDALTTAFPTAWTGMYAGKKTPMTRLRQFLKMGSHSGTTAFWDTLINILRKLPAEVLPKSYDEAADLLLAAHEGASRKEERFNASSAWPTYFTAVDIVTHSANDEDAENLIKAFAMPPLIQYLHPSEDSAKWSITGAKAATLVSKAALVRRLPPLLELKWPHLAEKLIEVAKMSQPEQSKDFDKSQKHLAGVGERWAELQRELYSQEYNLPASVLTTFATTNTRILEDCIALLRARNGKPYGAAAVIAEQLRTCGLSLLQNADYKATLLNFVSNDVPTLLFTPSQRSLVRCLYAMQAEESFLKLFRTSLDNILSAEEPDESKIGALHALFSPNMPKEAVAQAKTSELLQSYFISQPLSSNSARLSLFADMLKVGAISQESTDKVMSTLTETLSLSGPELQDGLSALEKLANSHQSAIQSFMSHDSGKQLLPSVVKLEQSPVEAIAEKASTLSKRLSSAMGAAATDAKYSVVLHNLQDVSAQSLPLGSVLDLAEKLESENQDIENVKDILPSLDVWRRSIAAVTEPPKQSLSLLSPLGGAVHLVQADTGIGLHPAQYDAEGISQALRTATYLARTIVRSELASKLGDDFMAILALLHICVLLAEDNTSILGANGLWIPADPHSVEMEVMDFVSDANSLLRQYWEATPPISTNGELSAFEVALESIRQPYDHLSPMAYYTALSSAKAHENMFELHGYSTEQRKTSDELLKNRRSNKDTLALATFIIGFGQPLAGSQTLTRCCNELVADLTDLVMDANQPKGLELLVTLNAILHSQPEILASVQKTRLIVLVKRMIAWLENNTIPPIKAEACKALTHLTVSISDMYGEHWTQVVGLLVNFWSTSGAISDDNVVSETGVMLVHASLKLFGALQKLAKGEEANDDLVEALQENKDQLHGGLLDLLVSAGEVSDETHQPLMVTNELLARELSQASFKAVPNAEELFPLLYTPSHAVQGAAFDLLHKQIPAAQEQISFDAALDNKTAQLPDELLSLIIDAPTLDSLAEASFERTMPLSLQGFLYSWRLLFDHFDGSSFRVKSDYGNQIKDGGFLTGLLNLILDFLGHTRGKPIDASKFDIQEYVSGTEPSPEKDVQWLLTHLYYLSLLHVPSLVKSYYLNVRSRQTSQAIESWTARYIAPLITSATLQSVADWADKAVKDDPDYENMSVKVGMRSREVNVSYEIDEQNMAIKVVLPEAYPIDSAKVISVTRVAVKEEKWNAWLRNCQGVITFSNGSIIDGLSAWRKNVTAALKGHTECAICYSLINSNKELPTKRCPTCKHLYHSTCLVKWFRSSNASTCPLCRNPFNFN